MPLGSAGRESKVSISQPPAQGRGKSGAKPGGSGPASSGAGSGRPPSGNGRGAGNGRNGGQPGQRPAGGRQSQSAPGSRAGTQRNPSQKTAGNRQVTAKTAAQRQGARPGDRGKPGAGRPGDRGRSGAKAPASIGRRPSPTMLGLGAIFVVIVVVLVLVLVGTSGSGTKAKDLGVSTTATPSLVAAVTSVPESVYAKVGLPSEISNTPAKVKGFPPLTAKHLPEMLYMGAEYCPFCAATRWAMVMALSKFGTFSGLRLTYSSATDFAPDTPTFSFHGTTYTSQYLVFQPYELATNAPVASSSACNVNGYACLDTPPQSDVALLENKALGGGSFPFIDFGNKLYQSGAAFQNAPLALQGYTYDQIAAQLSNSSSAVAQAEVGEANYLTAAISRDDGEQADHGVLGSLHRYRTEEGGSLMTERRTAVKRPPVSQAGLGPKPRLSQRTVDADADAAPRLAERARRAETHQSEELEDRTRPERPWRSLALMGLALAGIGVSVYVTILHYAHVKPVCSDNGAIDCIKVLTSPQSVFLGIPVPVYGLFFFVVMFVACIPRLWRTTLWWVPWARLAMSAVGIVFALRLIYEELFVIRSLCLWCTGAHVLSFAMFVIIVTGWEDATLNVIPRRAS